MAREAAQLDDHQTTPKQDLLDEIRQWVLSGAAPKLSGGVAITGLWRVGCNFRPNSAERLFTYHIVVAQTLGQGASYYEGQELSNHQLVELVGTAYSGQATGNRAIDIALLDSVAASLPYTPNDEICFSGRSSSKALRRARLLGDEIASVAAPLRSNRQLTVCMVGVVSLAIRELLERGFNVVASDREESLVGKKLFGEVEILPSDNSIDLVAESDVALITGMALSTATLRPMLASARENGTSDLPPIHVPVVMRVGVWVSVVSFGCWGRRSVAEPVPAAVATVSATVLAANAAGVM